MGHDGGEVVELRLPSEQLARGPPARDDLGRVAGARTGAIDGKVGPGHALDRIDDLDHGKRVAVAAIERR